MEKFWASLLDELAVWSPRICMSLAIYLGFLLAAAAAHHALGKFFRRVKLDESAASILARAARLGLHLFGVITACGTLGVDISAIVAGLGLTGFAVGFALKDTIANLLSGILVLLYKPFGLGSRIRIAGFEGTVVAINLRYTELCRETDRTLIPNGKIFTDPIVVLREETAAQQSPV